MADNPESPILGQCLTIIYHNYPPLTAIFLMYSKFGLWKSNSVFVESPISGCVIVFMFVPSFGRLITVCVFSLLVVNISSVLLFPRKSPGVPLPILLVSSFNPWKICSSMGIHYFQVWSTMAIAGSQGNRPSKWRFQWETPRTKPLEPPEKSPHLPQLN